MIGDLLTNLQTGLPVENKKNLEGSLEQPEVLFSVAMDGVNSKLPLTKNSEMVNGSVGASPELFGEASLVGSVEGDKDSVEIIQTERGNVNEKLSSNSDNFSTITLGNHAIIRESLLDNKASVGEQGVVLASDLIKSVTEADIFSKNLKNNLSVDSTLNNVKNDLTTEVVAPSFADYLSMDERRLSRQKVSVGVSSETEAHSYEFISGQESSYLYENLDKLNSVDGSQIVFIKPESDSKIEPQLDGLSESIKFEGFAMPPNDVLGKNLTDVVNAASLPKGTKTSLTERSGFVDGLVAEAVRGGVGLSEALKQGTGIVKQDALVIAKQSDFMPVLSQTQLTEVFKSELKPSLIALKSGTQVAVKPLEQTQVLPSLQSMPMNLDAAVSVSFKQALGGVEPKLTTVIDSTLADLPTKLKESIGNNQTAMTIRLKPYELGRIDVQIKDLGGELQMVFKAEKPSTLDVLQSSESALRSAFKDGGSLELSYGGSGKEGSGRGGSDKNDSLDSLPAGVVESDAQLVSNLQNETESRGLNLVV